MPLPCCWGRVELSAEKTSSVVQWWLCTEFLGWCPQEMVARGTCRPRNQLAFSVLWILAQMLHLQGTGWISLPSDDWCTLGYLLKTWAGFLTLPTACIGLWLGDAPRIQVDSLSLWIATGLPAYPEDHSSIDHLTQGESGRCFVGLGLQWYPLLVSSEALSGFSFMGVAQSSLPCHIC